LILGVDGPDLDAFAAAAAAALAKAAPGQMLSANICANYHHGISRLRSNSRVKQLAAANAPSSANVAAAALFGVTAQDFLADTSLAEEVFGPSSLVVRCRDIAQLTEVLGALEGQLTATVHLDAADHPAAGRLLPVLERKVGRILMNGWPTGVEVCHAMVHGGPYPATSDSRTTSVGSLAIDRFLRPVCYQDVPEALLPPELKNDPSLGLRRLVNGSYE
jgi:NADP-dependent aldehyde dehydrogenase